MATLITLDNGQISNATTYPTMYSALEAINAKEHKTLMEYDDYKVFPNLVIIKQEKKVYLVGKHNG